MTALLRGRPGPAAANRRRSVLERASAFRPRERDREKILAAQAAGRPAAEEGRDVVQLRLLERLAADALRQGDYDSALKRYEETSALLDRMPVTRRHLGRPVVPPAVVSVFKLAHDLQQFEFLVRRGVLEPVFLERTGGYVDVLDEMMEAGEFFRLVDEELAERLGPLYGRLIHADRPGPVPEGALNPALDFKRIERDFKERRPPAAVADRILSPRALSRLRRMARESVIWHDVKLTAHLGVLLDHGLACGLIFQIARELRERLPAVLGRLPFQNAWSFKYGPGGGIGLHADGGRVTLNLWLTPDKANLDPGSGGMVICDVKAPARWTLGDYSGYQAAERIGRRVSAAGTGRMRVAYGSNRGVLFDSKLFHEADACRFQDAHESRRVSLTLLFGEG